MDLPLIQPDIRGLHQLPKPEPAAGIQAYRRERRRALARSPRRLWNFAKYNFSRRRSAKVSYLPIKLDIENISRCNFRCTTCQVSDWKQGKRAGDMSLDNFRALLDEQYGLVEIKLQGMGEPLMQGDDFFEMIRLARAHHIWVRTVTNGSLLHLRDNFKKLIDSGVNEVQISIDGAKKSTFEAIRRGADFETVLENCRRINAYCKARGLERTKMWTVVQRANEGELCDLVDLAADLGFSTQVFALNLVDWGNPDWRVRNDAVSVLDHFSCRTARELIERGESRGVKVRFWIAVERFRAGSPGTICPWPFERTFVSSDSRIVPCCVIANPDNFELNGAKGAAGIWKGRDYRAFRQAHLDGRIPDVCKSCYDAQSLAVETKPHGRSNCGSNSCPPQF